jgi:hypothetical protein
MNEPENKITDSSEVAELKKECADLRRQSNFLLIGLVVISFTFAAFVGLQARRAGKDLAALRPQAAQFQEANQKEAPGIQQFLGRLLEFGQKNPDFMPILNKYNIRTDTNAALPGGAPAQPAPAANR